MKRWFKVDFNDVFFNGLTTNQIGILIKYRCYCQQFDVDELNVDQFKANFEWKERKFLVKFLSSKGQLSDKTRTTLEQKKSKSGQNNDNFGVNEDKNGNFLSRENNDLAIYNIYNKDNNIKEKKEKRDNTVADCFFKQAGRLAEIIRSVKNIKVDNRKISSWAKSIEQLNRIEGVAIERIESALDWYADNIGGEFIPVIESGASFREKFTRLESAMNRHHDATNDNEKEEFYL